MAINTSRKTAQLPSSPQIITETTQFSKRDLLQIARIYQHEIDQGFLSSLGDEVATALFDTALKCPSGILIAALDPQSKTICGFICATLSTGSFYKSFLLRKWLVSLRYVAPKLITPDRLFRAFETLLYPARQETIAMPTAELLVIAVQKNKHGSGIAQTLFSTLEKTLAARGVDQFKVVVGSTLHRACRFYEKQYPVSIHTTELHRGQTSRIYVYDTKVKHQ